ncbi:MAG: phosphonate C-P lyase system protein PhnH [Oceanidesulfovibrio sp.]
MTSQKMNTQNALQPAFSDPVLDSQRYFRAALEALSRPGKIVTADGDAHEFGHPALLHPATAGLCLTLMDGDTPVWLDCQTQGTRREIAGWLRFHCGCRIVHEPFEAVFALITDCQCMPRFKAFSQGTLRDPHLAATMIVQVEDFVDSAATHGMTLAGPGVKDCIRFTPLGLPEWFRDDLTAQRKFYPQGVDIFLTAGSRMAGLPRSVRNIHSGDAPCT